jgi:diadenosine tetraphosphatase ApaH/serine/threonine PP2A family protein phosphatase
MGAGALVRVAVLNDIHGNLPAFEAVLAEVPDDALVVFGGDIVAGPMPKECLALARSLAARARFLMGNGDHRKGAGPDEEVWERRRDWIFEEQLGDEQRQFLEEMPPTQSIEVVELGRTLFCHGSPRDENEIITAITSPERLREILDGVEERVVVCGHTHHQFDRVVEPWRLINAGSVGMPYEGRRGAFWALLGPDVELRRTDYDVEAAAEAIRATGYPEPEEDPLPNLLDPPTAGEAAEHFEQQALAR